MHLFSPEITSLTLSSLPLISVVQTRKQSDSHSQVYKGSAEKREILSSYTAQKMIQFWWFLSFLMIVGAVSHLEQQWHLWKDKHGKVYMDITEEQKRRDVWIENMAKIQKFNNQASSNFTLAINQFADLVSVILSSVVHH